MSGALLWVSALLCPDAQVTAEQAVVVEVLTPTEPVFAQQLFPLRLQITVDQEFVRTQMLQAFRRPLELPVQVEVPWLFGDSRILVREPSAVEEPQTPLRFVLNGAIVQANSVHEQLHEGRAQWVVEVERRALVREAGILILAGPQAQFAWTTGFSADLFGNPVPQERHDVRRSGAEATLTVLDWPVDERPVPFGGAVGRVELRVDRQEGQESSPALLTVRIGLTGDANWETMSAPDLTALAGFHLLGQLESRTAMGLEVRADFSREATAGAEFPALAYPFLDPGPPAVYRMARSAPLALTALPADVEALKPPPEPPASPDPVHPALPVLGGFALALIFWTLLRNRTRIVARFVAAPPPTESLPMAAASTSDPAAAWSAFLVERTGLTPSALHEPRLATRLQEHGVSKELATRGAQLFEDLQAARYGGPPVADAATRLHALIAEWPRTR